MNRPVLDDQAHSRAVTTPIQHRLAVLGLLCVAFWFRQIDLLSLPPFVHGDGANLAAYSLRVARGDEPWFGVRTDGDTNWAFLQFAPYSLLGGDLLALRYMAGWWGVLSLAGIYFGVRRLFGSDVALTALCLGSTAHLLVHFSRAASIVMPSVLTSFLAMGLLASAQNRSRSGRSRWLAYFVAGAAAAANLYQYAAAKAMLVGFAGLWLAGLAVSKGRWRESLGGGLALACGALIVAAPIGVWYVQHPAQLGDRFAELSVFNPRYAATNMKLYGTLDQQTVLSRQIARSLGGFFIVDDTSPNYRIQAPLMDLPTTILALAGIVVAVRRNWRRTLALLASLAAGLVGGAVLLIEPPTSYHYILLVPIALLFAAIALQWMFSRWVGRPWVPIIILGIATLNLLLYFGVYPTHGAWYSTESSVGFYAQKRSRCCQFVFVGYPDLTPREISRLAARPATIDYVTGPDDVDGYLARAPSDGRPWVFIFSLDRQAYLIRMQQRFPLGKVAEHQERGRVLFWTLTVDDAGSFGSGTAGYGAEATPSEAAAARQR